MNFTPLIILIISGIFIQISFLFEKLYRDRRDNYFDDNYYFELYRVIRALAFIELSVGLLLYIKSPLPPIFPIPNVAMFLVYHVMVCLVLIISGAWIFEKVYEKINNLRK